jgi:hypothetical protein
MANLMYAIVCIVRQIKTKRLGWFGHIQRMEEHRITRNITNWMPTLLNRPKGRPKDRWWDIVRGDLKIVGVLDWKKNVLERKYWQGILEKAKTHPGLYSLIIRRRCMLFMKVSTKSK